MKCYRYILSFLLVISCITYAQTVSAVENSFSLTVTPPLFQLSISPGESWSSVIKAVNTNPYDTSLFTSVMEFQATGEEGQGKLIPITEKSASSSGSTLADWVTVGKEPIPAKKGTSVDVPFSVQIPKDAAPGGYYAAILIGSQPFEEQPSGSVISVSSYISSLLFVRIKGDMVEQGIIREFSTDHYFYQHPKVQFTMKFDNTGTVHVRPVGMIEVYSMWGNKVEDIAINEKSNFGNVLAHSVRKFSFSWDGEDSLMNFGLYNAILTLSFGSDAKQSISAETSFWIVPVVPLAYLVGGILAIVLLLLWIVRVSIRRTMRKYHVIPQTDKSE